MNTSRGGGGKRGADPIFSILNAVFKMSKKCIFPRRRENADPPACQKIAPRGIGVRRGRRLGRYRMRLGRC